MLGENFTSADYWRHRNDSHVCDPRFFEIITKEDASIDVRLPASSMDRSLIYRTDAVSVTILWTRAER